ncbi:MAG: alginate export family protein [Chitinophagaceae bacterium]
MKRTVLFLTIISSLHAASQHTAAFKQLRYDEDYSLLRNDTTTSWYKSLKYKALGKNKTAYISTGGDIRYQYLWFKNENWGEPPADKDGYLLTRLLVHADLHAGKHFRTFVQLQSSLANGKEDAPSPVDENQLDLHQVFVDVVPFSNSKHTVMIRVGRQELLYGSQRLVAVRDGPNNRQAFDAAKLVYTHKDWKADLFFSHYVRSKQQIFDDGFNKNTKFWGAYIVKNKLPLIENMDLYYFGLRKINAVFDDGAGKETRHSIGSRIWNSKGNWRYDVEGLYQFGNLDNKRIAAWTFSINTGYKFSRTKLQPEIGLKTELISGDKTYGDGQIQTFNPLFPRGGYFGLVSLIGPVNLFDVHPSLAFDFTKKMSLNLDCDIFWRQRITDGIYGPNAALIYSGKNSLSTFIGNQFSTDLVYMPDKFLYLRVEFTWFRAGAFLKDVSPGKDILFIAFTAQFKF